MAQTKEILGNEIVVEIAPGYTLTAPKLRGTLSVLSEQENITRSDNGVLTKELQRALQNVEIESPQIIEIDVKDDGVDASAGATRSAETLAATGEGEPAIIFTAPNLGDDVDQIVLYTDEAGVSRWVFPEGGGGVPVRSTRGGGADVVFHLPRQTAPHTSSSPDPKQTRGPMAKLGRRMIHLLAWATDDIVGKGALAVAKKWEDSRRPSGLVPFPIDSAAPEQTIDWSRMTGGRALLFIHGTFSRTSSAFAELPTPVTAKLSEIYGGRMFAFDHPSMSVSPQDNARTLIEMLPQDIQLDLDIVTHSRGGLLGRELIERFSELEAGGRKIKISRAVMVAAPQRGTILTDADHGVKLIDRYTNLLTNLPDDAYTLTMEGVLMLVKLLAHGALKGLPGLQSMYPSGDYLRRLNAVSPNETKYFAVGSQFVPTIPALGERFGKYLGDRLLDSVFDEASDGVVPTSGSYEIKTQSTLFPIADSRRLLFAPEDGVHHCNYFAKEQLHRRMLEWLSV